MRPGRWLVESRREGEAPARGRADVLRLDGGCVLLERLVLHFEDGSSHLVFFVQGRDPDGAARLVQIGDHPLFLVWEPRSGTAEAFGTTRTTSRGPVELRWTARPTDDGFRRELSVRREGETGWSFSEAITYSPLGATDDPDALPPLEPGPFHDPDACRTEAFRAMDYLLGDWLNEEWVRDDGTWTPASVSRVSVESLIGGCALLERHPVYEDGELERRLLVLRGYDEAAERWRQVVFGHGGGAWEWDVEAVDDGWLLTPVGGELENRLRILENSSRGNVAKRIQVREDGAWRTVRRIRYVPW